MVLCASGPTFESFAILLYRLAPITRAALEIKIRHASQTDVLQQKNTIHDSAHVESTAGLLVEADAAG